MMDEPILPSPLLSLSQNKAPRSNRFDDTYYDDENGLNESRHVFLGGCLLPQGWQNHRQFVICETGFGTGLNFLSAWHLWRQTSPNTSLLHFISVEGFPLSRSEMRLCLERWSEMAPLAVDLLQAYPDPQPGMHRLFFEGGRVVLTLLFEPVAKALGDLEVDVDAWFLDGFAPDRNPDMWQVDVYKEMARLSKPDARLATFSAAGSVRRDLHTAGFEVAKREGSGRNREFLFGTYKGEPTQSRLEPWFCQIKCHFKDSTPCGRYWKRVGRCLFRSCVQAPRMFCHGHRQARIGCQRGIVNARCRLHAAINRW